MHCVSCVPVIPLPRPPEQCGCMWPAIAVCTGLWVTASVDAGVDVTGLGVTVGIDVQVAVAVDVNDTCAQGCGCYPCPPTTAHFPGWKFWASLIGGTANQQMSCFLGRGPLQYPVPHRHSLPWAPTKGHEVIIPFLWDPQRHMHLD